MNERKCNQCSVTIISNNITVSHLFSYCQYSALIGGLIVTTMPVVRDSYLNSHHNLGWLVVKALQASIIYDFFSIVAKICWKFIEFPRILQRYVVFVCDFHSCWLSAQKRLTIDEDPFASKEFVCINIHTLPEKTLKVLKSPQTYAPSSNLLRKYFSFLFQDATVDEIREPHCASKLNFYSVLSDEFH